MATFFVRITAPIALLLLVGLTGCQPVSSGVRPTANRTVHIRMTDPATGQPVPGQSITGFYADRIEITPASRFVAQQTDSSGKLELPVDLGRKPVLDAAGTRVSLDVKKLRAGQTQVIQTGQACACCDGEKHAERPLRVEVSCR